MYFIDWNGQPEVSVQEEVAEMSPGTDFQGGADFSPVPEEPLFTEVQAYEGEIPPLLPDEQAPLDEPYLTPADEIPMGSEIEIPGGLSDTSDFSDVTDFANADTLVGPLTYVVVIEGIESSLLLNQLKEAMTDSRFSWDVTSLLKGIKQGQLILSGLSPAKASVLINRIKYLPFKISWRQDVLSNS
ncbi:MAG: hypothetical protein AAGB31_03550 [Bdellovibrio sp.]